MRNPKIFFVGAGNVGATSALEAARRKAGNIYLYDINEGLAIGKSLDINQALPSMNSDAHIIASSDIADMADSDIVVISAGIPRRSGMTRLDLLESNLSIIDPIMEKVAEIAPRARVFIITNPVDILTAHTQKKYAGLEIFGLGCSLDSLRFRYFMANIAGASVDTAHGIVLGIHSNDMIPLIETASLGGIPITSILSPEQLIQVVDLTRNAGTEIVKHLKDRSGYYAAGNIIADIIDSVVTNRKRIFSLDVSLDAVPELDGICLSLPSIVGSNGVESVVLPELSESKLKSLQNLADFIVEHLE